MTTPIATYLKPTKDYDADHAVRRLEELQTQDQPEGTMAISVTCALDLIAKISQ